MNRPSAVGVDPDAALVAAAQSGKQDAFVELVRRHQHRVYNLALRFLGDATLAEDVAQEVFVSLFRNIASFRGGARFTSWLYQIVLNQARTRMRYRQRRPDMNAESLDVAPSGESDDRPREFSDPDPEGDPEARLSARESAEVVQTALDELDDDHRAVLILRDIEDLNYSEIAELLGVAEGTIKSRIHRARNQLRQRLSKHIDVEDQPK